MVSIWSKLLISNFGAIFLGGDEIIRENVYSCECVWYWLWIVLHYLYMYVKRSLLSPCFLLWSEFLRTSARYCNFCYTWCIEGRLFKMCLYCLCCRTPKRDIAHYPSTPWRRGQREGRGRTRKSTRRRSRWEHNGAGREGERGCQAGCVLCLLEGSGHVPLSACPVVPVSHARFVLIPSVRVKLEVVCANGQVQFLLKKIVYVTC